MATDQPTLPDVCEPDEGAGPHHVSPADGAGSADGTTGPGPCLADLATDPVRVDRSLDGVDWTTSAVGPPELWSAAWTTAAQLCLDSLEPTSVMLGPDLVQIYNSAYAALLSGKGKGMGRPASQNWAEIWDVIGPPIRAILDTGTGLSLADQQLYIERNGSITETFFTYSCVPIREPDGRVSGVFNAAIETTERALARRRTDTLRNLAEVGRDTRSPREFCRQVCQVLSSAGYDLPFGLVYRFDRAAKQYRLGGSFGLTTASPVAPEWLNPAAASSWVPVQAMAEAVIVEDLATRFPPLSAGPWPESPTRALVGPISVVSEAAPDQPAAVGTPRSAGGLVVLGIGTRLDLDDAYRTFLAEVTATIEAGLAAATAEEMERVRTSNLQAALESSRLIGAAIGVLMAIHKITEDQAFDLLRRTSQSTHRKLRDIADRVVQTGSLTDTGDNPGE